MKGKEDMARLNRKRNKVKGYCVLCGEQEGCSDSLDYICGKCTAVLLSASKESAQKLANKSENPVARYLVEKFMTGASSIKLPKSKRMKSSRKMGLNKNKNETGDDNGKQKLYRGRAKKLESKRGDKPRLRRRSME